MIDVEEFSYPMPADEAQKAIEDHDKEWVEYWCKTNRKGFRPKNTPKYQQAYVEQLYGAEPAQRGSYTPLEFVTKIREERIQSKDEDLPKEFIWNFILVKAESMACEVNRVWTSYGELLLDASWGPNFQTGYRYNYYKAIACGMDPKSAYYRAVARAMDGML